MDKARLTQNDISSRIRNKHSATCNNAITWTDAKIVGIEARMARRKFLEGIMKRENGEYLSIPIIK